MRAKVSAALILAVVLGSACVVDHVDTFGVVVSASDSEVCFRANDSGTRICVTDKILERSGDSFSVGDCVRLRSVPEASGAATLTVRASTDCSPTK